MNSSKSTFAPKSTKPTFQTLWSPKIEPTPNLQKRQRLLQILRDYPIERLPVLTEEVRSLAASYLHYGVIPKDKEADALHVAIAVISNMDFLVSWNYRHLANVHRVRRIQGVNALLGYPSTLRIVTPFELMDIDYG